MSRETSLDAAGQAGPIGLMAAMPQELQALIDLMPDEAAVCCGSRVFWRGHLHGQEVVAVLSGIGKVSAATTATLLIDRFKVQRIVFTGVAGGLGPGVKVGDVVLARSFLQHDMDASPLFPRHEVPLYGRARFEADAALADALELACERMLHSAKPRGCQNTLPWASSCRWNRSISRPSLRWSRLAASSSWRRCSLSSFLSRQAVP